MKLHDGLINTARNLEYLIEAAQKSKDFAHIDKAKLSARAGSIEHNMPHGFLHYVKKDLIEQLTGVKLPKRKANIGSLAVIVESYVYLTKDLSISDIKEVVKQEPGVLSYSVKNTIRPKVEYLKSIGVEDISNLIRKRPELLSYSLTKKIKTRVSYLRKIGIGNVGKVIEACPQILQFSDDTIKYRVEKLMEFGVKDVGKTIERFPYIPTYNPNKSFNANIRYLHRIGVRDVKRVVEKLPTILTYNKEDMKLRINYLKEIGVTRIGHVIELCPSLIELSVEDTMKPRSDYLTQIGIRDVGRAVREFPAILTYKLSSIKSKVEFYMKNGYSIENIEKCPTSLGYSLTKRIEPRLEFLISIGKKLPNIALMNILRPNDTYFSVRFTGTKDAYANFCVANRYPSSSQTAQRSK